MSLPFLPLSMHLHYSDHVYRYIVYSTYIYIIIFIYTFGFLRIMILIVHHIPRLHLLSWSIPTPYLSLSSILSSIDPLRICLPSTIIKFSTLALHVDMQKSSIMIGIPRADLYNLHAFVLLANEILCMHVCVMYSESKEGRAIVKSYWLLTGMIYNL